MFPAALLLFTIHPYIWTYYFDVNFALDIQYEPPNPFVTKLLKLFYVTSVIRQFAIDYTRDGYKKSFS